MKPSAPSHPRRLPLPWLAGGVVLLALALWMLAQRMVDVTEPAADTILAQRLQTTAAAAAQTGRSASISAAVVAPGPTTVAELVAAHPDLDQALLLRAASLCNPTTHVCSRRLSWEELGVLLDADAPRWLARMPEEYAGYLERKEYIRAHYRSTSDFVRHTKYDVACRQVPVAEPADALHPAQPKLACDFPDADPVFDAAAGDALPASWFGPNDFGYALDRSILHEVIWLRVRLPRDSAVIPRLVERYRPAAQFETRHLVNPAQLMTIPELFHIHVFSRTRNQSTGTDSALVQQNAEVKGVGAHLGDHVERAVSSAASSIAAQASSHSSALRSAWQRAKASVRGEVHPLVTDPAAGLTEEELSLARKQHRKRSRKPRRKPEAAGSAAARAPLP